jgi:hypothetical protein
MAIKNHKLIDEEIKNGPEVLTVKQIAKVTKVNVASVYALLSKGLLKSIRDPITEQHAIRKEDLLKFRSRRYRRDFSKKNGKPLYTETEISIGNAARMLGKTYNHLYFKIMEGDIKSSRKGCAWIIKMKELEIFAKKNKIKLDLSKYYI